MVSRDELGVVAQSFNQMTERLLHLYETSRNLSAHTHIGALLAQTSSALQPLAPGVVALALLEERDGWRLYAGDDAGNLQQVATTSPRGELVRPRDSCLGLVIMALALTSCASWHAQYLKAAQNHATLAEVEQHLGRPHSTWDLHTGETLWTYQAGLPSATNSGGVTIVGPGWVIGQRSDCSEYILLFDSQRIDIGNQRRVAFDDDLVRVGERPGVLDQLVDQRIDGGRAWLDEQFT